MNIKPENKAWHALPVDDVFNSLASSSEGLSQEEVEDRRKHFGDNALNQEKKDSVLKILLRQLNNPLIYILIAAVALALTMGKITDAIVVAAVIVLNTLIGFIQEYQAGNSINALLSLIPDEVKVLRRGEQQRLPSTELVPGDYVVLEAGDKVPADIRITSAKNLRADESILTGESVPADKATKEVAEDSALADRHSMLFSGTLLSSGTAEGIVTGTGKNTELGNISRLIDETESVKSPLTNSLQRIAKVITFGVIAVGIVVFGIGMIRGYELSDALLSALTLAVATVPEGLPAVITVASSIGVSRMARRKAIIRHLPSVETLGSTTVICSDKTGTLTKNEMTVQRLLIGKGEIGISGLGVAPDGEFDYNDGIKEEDVQELLNAAVLCNDARITREEDGSWKGIGDPTEVAMITMARKAGKNEEELRERYDRLNVIPFDSETKIMATLNDVDGRRILYVKGAPEALASRITQDGDMSAEKLSDQALELARDGMRVLALASREMSSEQDSIEEEDLKDLQFLGLAAMSDPPKEEVKSAIATCHEAGIVVKMITGDHPSTASAIGKELGLANAGKAMTGEDLEKAGEGELQNIVKEVNIFARVSPQDKLKLVEALQKNGEVVAMTGDGVNDAPALKRADIGVAMGIAGTSASKEAADMVLANDNFESIEAAVEEGRRVFDNLLKCIVFVLPTSFGLGLIIFAAVLFFPSDNGGMLTPMQPVQVLWVNLITAVALTVPLAFEIMEPDIMKKAPRDNSRSILSGFVTFRIIIVSLIMAGGTIGLFLWKFYGDLKNGGDYNTALAEAQTMAVTAMVLFQVFYLLNCRSLHHSMRHVGLFSNLYIYGGILAVLLAQAAFVYVPFMNEWFHGAALNFIDWLYALLAALLVSLSIGLEKWIRNRRKAPDVE